MILGTTARSAGTFVAVWLPLLKGEGSRERAVEVLAETGILSCTPDGNVL